MTNKSSLVLATGLLAGALLLQGCDTNDNDDNEAAARYEITVTNLSHNQAFSPLAVVLHRPGFTGWEMGSSVSNGLEQLAEGGDVSAWLAEADSNPNVRITSSGTGAIAPGAQETLSIEVMHEDELSLTMATMLVNTNDAFTGLSGLHVGHLENQQSITINAPALDAGTEDNDEMAAYIPGPAGGGEGYNADRNDRDFVIIHPGVVSVDDGLSSSALDNSHRFDNPVARITVVRTN